LGIASRKKEKGTLIKENIQWATGVLQGEGQRYTRGSGAREAEENCYKDIGDTVRTTDRWTEVRKSKRSK